jgi:peptide/nickel transport system substrate-binding protein
MKIIPDTATMFLELKNNSIDLMGLTPLQYVKQTDYPAFRREFNRFKYLAFSYTYIGYNLRHDFFRDRRVRQALAYAINKQRSSTDTSRPGNGCDGSLQARHVGIRRERETV